MSTSEEILITDRCVNVTIFAPIHQVITFPLRDQSSTYRDMLLTSNATDHVTKTPINIFLWIWRIEMKKQYELELLYNATRFMPEVVAAEERKQTTLP